MRRPTVLAAVVVAMILSPEVAAAGEASREARTVAYPIAQAIGYLELSLSEGWSASREVGPEFSTITVSPPTKGDLLLILTPLPQNGTLSERALRQRTRDMGAPALAQSVEDRLEMRPLEGTRVRGFVFTLTDRELIGREPKPGEYRKATSGVLVTGDLLISTTILHQTEDDPLLEEALEILRGVRFTETVSAGAEVRGNTNARLRYPGRSWSLVLQLPGFDLGPARSRSRPPGVSVDGYDIESGVTVSVFVEESVPGGDALACRKHHFETLRRRSPLPMKKVRYSERNETALAEYVVPRYQEVPLDQKHVHAYMAREGVCIDIHVSKAQHRSEDDDLFDRVLSSFRFEDDGP